MRHNRHCAGQQSSSFWPFWHCHHSMLSRTCLSWLQISLVGVNIRRDDNGNAELKLLNLELFTAPSDDVTMTAITCTPEGRIFLGGADSNLYELEYRSQASWRKGRCNKVGGILLHVTPLLTQGCLCRRYNPQTVCTGICPAEVMCCQQVRGPCIMTSHIAQAVCLHSTCCNALQ